MVTASLITLRIAQLSQDICINVMTSSTTHVQMCFSQQRKHVEKYRILSSSESAHTEDKALKNHPPLNTLWLNRTLVRSSTEEEQQSQWKCTVCRGREAASVFLASSMLDDVKQLPGRRKQPQRCKTSFQKTP